MIKATFFCIDLIYQAVKEEAFQITLYCLYPAEFQFIH